MPTVLCRKCGNTMQAYATCHHCKQVIQKICAGCKTMEYEEVHYHKQTGINLELI